MFYNGFDIHVFLQYPDIFYLPFFVQNDVGQSVTFAYPEIIEIVDKQGLNGRVKHIIVLTGVFLIEVEVFVKEINAHDAGFGSYPQIVVVVFVNVIDVITFNKLIRLPGSCGVVFQFVTIVTVEPVGGSEPHEWVVIFVYGSDRVVA